jgi:hypothetical protein
MTRFLNSRGALRERDQANRGVAALRRYIGKGELGVIRRSQAKCSEPSRLLVFGKDSQSGKKQMTSAADRNRFDIF